VPLLAFCWLDELFFGVVIGFIGEYKFIAGIPLIKSWRVAGNARTSLAMSHEMDGCALSTCLKGERMSHESREIHLRDNLLASL
jgi:hypothetical protein